MVKAQEVVVAVRGFRQDLGISQRQFAIELGVGIATIKRWESGKVSPSRMARQRLRNMLNRQGL